MTLLPSMKHNFKKNNNFNCQFQFISIYFTTGFNFHLKDDRSEPGKGIYFHLCRNQNVKKRDIFGREKGYVTLNRGEGGYNIKGKIFQNCKKNIFHQEMFPNAFVVVWHSLALPFQAICLLAAQLWGVCGGDACWLQVPLHFTGRSSHILLSRLVHIYVLQNNIWS